MIDPLAEGTHSSNMLGPTLTLEKLEATLAEFQANFPKPDAWVYGIEVPPLGGPIGVNYGELVELIRAGWVEPIGLFPKIEWHWTPSLLVSLKAQAPR